MKRIITGLTQNKNKMRHLYVSYLLINTAVLDLGCEASILLCSGWGYIEIYICIIPTGKACNIGIDLLVPQSTKLVIKVSVKISENSY